MPAERFVEQLNQQIANEFAASQQYVAAAVHYDGQTLPRLAGFFYRQALEERDHAMMMVRYLLDIGAQVTVPGVAEPRRQFADIIEPVQLALDQERRVSEQIGALAGVAREEGDYASEQFMQWFIREQVEEVSTMSGLLDVVRREHARPMEIEEYLARETPARDAPDAFTPPIAGA